MKKLLLILTVLIVVMGLITAIAITKRSDGDTSPDVSQSNTSILVENTTPESSFLQPDVTTQEHTTTVAMTTTVNALTETTVPQTTTKAPVTTNAQTTTSIKPITTTVVVTTLVSQITTKAPSTTSIPVTAAPVITTKTPVTTTAPVTTPTTTKAPTTKPTTTTVPVTTVVTTKAPVTTAPITTTIPPQTKPEPITVSINVGTYNVKHFAVVDHDFSIIADDIRGKDLDIVGLQEIDYCNSRSDMLNEPELIAKELGWYYAFSKSIDYRGGGYGHCIVSKYPIVSYNTVYLPSGTYEQRSFGHAVIDVNGVHINFINTHLSYGSSYYGGLQFQSLGDYLSKLDGFILTGDFNTSDLNEFAPIKNAVYINGDKKYYLTASADDPKKSIDNIVISNYYEYRDPAVLPDVHSDHLMFYVTVTVKIYE